MWIIRKLQCENEEPEYQVGSYTKQDKFSIHSTHYSRAMAEMQIQYLIGLDELCKIVMRPNESGRW